MDIRNAVDPYRNDGCTTHRTDFQGFEVKLIESLGRKNSSCGSGRLTSI